ncbi:hypothetical protein [Homoserinimonas sp. OAct 916]|uniref:hypothetical protein n=1 Tax=Homoserinimonas sp. OAct 916 TaxID=2211450 RepID=UPI001300BA8A|nr:hypothetical protein [Homoserinimonas sp. OAct 916]
MSVIAACADERSANQGHLSVRDNKKLFSIQNWLLAIRGAIIVLLVYGFFAGCEPRA